MKTIKPVILAILFTLSTETLAAITQFVNIGGQLTLSTDGCSSQNRTGARNPNGRPESDTCAITINKPAGASVNKALLIAAGDVAFSDVPIINPVTVTINGTDYRPNLNQQAQDSSSKVSVGTVTAHVRYDDVTSTLASALNTLPTGNSTLQLVEEGGHSLEGMQLFVIWNDPASPETAIGISLGSVDTLTGIDENIDTLPIDTLSPDYRITAGTSIVFSTGTPNSSGTNDQVTELRLNGNIFANRAGGHDDGPLAMNGCLFTAGGEGDSPTSNDEDELYDASSVVSNGATSLNYTTSVPSGHQFDWMIAMWLEAKGVTNANVANTTARRNSCAHVDNSTARPLANIPAGYLQVYDNVTATAAALGAQTVSLTAVSGTAPATSSESWGLSSLGHISSNAPMWQMSGTGVANMAFPEGFNSNQLIGFNGIDTASSRAVITAYDPNGGLLDMADWTYEEADDGAGTTASISPTAINLGGNNTHANPVILLRPTPGQQVSRLRIEWSEAPGNHFNIFLGAIQCHDFGDAPDQFSTLNSSTGARHEMWLDNTVYLGSTMPDADYGGSDGTSVEGGFGNNITDDSGNASDDDTEGTDDEDGIANFPPLSDTTTGNYDIPLVCNGDGANIYAWLDFNNNGSFADAGEFTSTTCSDSGNGDGNATLSFNGYTVASTSGTTYIRVRATSDTLSASDHAGNATDGEVEDYPVPITGLCTALSGDVNNALSPTLHLHNGKQMFLGATSTDQREGHLEAFTIEQNGGLSATANWDAADEMTANERKQRLYSSNNSGTLTLINGLPDSAFASNGIPDAATIRAYTFNPSHDNGIYLNGRASNSLLGPLSPETNLVLVDNSIDTLAYLNDTTYQAFYNSTITQRSDTAGATNPSLVIASSDDGFVYAFKQLDGDLVWGWMPASLLPELKNHTTFQQQHAMQGKLDVMDLKDSNGDYATYLLGSYQQGVGQYVLKLAANGRLDSVVQEIHYSTMDTAPDNGARAYLTDASGKVYSVYTVTDTDASGNDSRLIISSITDKSVQKTISLGFVATSVPFIMPDFRSSQGPEAKKLYLGSNTGDVHAVSLLDGSGALRPDGTIQTEINNTVAASLNTASAVQFIGASASSTNGSFYLRVQSSEQLTLFRWKPQQTSWKAKWTTWAGGAGKWRQNSPNTLSEVPSIITPLPADATITGNATIVADSIVLPVTHAPTGNACYGAAHYYFYQLPNGRFPSQRFFQTDNVTTISDIVAIGYGDARKLHLSDLPGKDQLMGIGVADQTLNKGTGISNRILINDPIPYGIRSWREIR